MKQAAFSLYALVALMAGMLAGGSGAYGACVVLWGPRILDTALGAPPDRTHPAFWLSLALVVPGMLLGAAGALFLLILPAAIRFPVAAASTRPRDVYYWRLLRRYAESIARFTAAQEPPPNPALERTPTAGDTGSGGDAPRPQ